MPFKNMPDACFKIWEEVHTASKKAGDGEKLAAEKAYGAIKNAGWEHDAKGNWVKKNSLTEFSLRIDRASYDKATNERRVRAVASDTETDNRGDSMSLELYNDFIDRIKKNEPVPEEFRSDFWKGGEPYFSVSHYPDANGKAVPGTIDATYVDGKFLKSKGKFFDTPLGRKCFEAVCADLYGDTNKSNSDNKVRISIAFLDYMHKHKSNDYVFDRLANPDSYCPECFLEAVNGESKGKIFLRGHLIHEALTRVPVNTRTSMEVDKSMADKVLTRKDDAASIVGEELADELEEQTEIIGKSEALVIKSDEVNPGMKDNEAICPVCSNVVTPTSDHKCPVCRGDMSISPNIPEDATATVPKSEVIEEAKTNKAPKISQKDAEATCLDPLTNEIDPDCVTDVMSGILPLSEVGKSDVVEEAVTKKIGPENYPSSDFLVVEKPDNPSTWHLQVKKHGTPDHGLMGAAKAALTSPGGHRGNKYEGPNKAEAISKLKALYSSEKMTWQSEAEELQSFIVETVKSTIKETTMTEPTQTHPLDAFFSEFKNKFDAIINSEVTEEEKLQQVQEPFNSLGTGIVAVVKSSIKPKEVTPETKGQMDLVEALSKVMNPIAQKLDLVLTQLSTPQVERPMPTIPQRRSIPPSVAQQIPQIQVKKSDTPHLRDIIDRTV